MRTKYASSHGPNLKSLDEKIALEKDIGSALSNQASEASSAAVGDQPAAAPVRTLAAPEMDGDSLPNFDRRVTMGDL